MQVLVDNKKIRVLYSLGCSGIFYEDCTPQKNADPNGYVVQKFRGLHDVVVLFDGIGESQPVPYRDSGFDELIRQHKRHQETNLPDDQKPIDRPSESEPLNIIATFAEGGAFGEHYLNDIIVSDVLGNNTNFNYGLIDGYPGKFKGKQTIGIPNYIEGYWARPFADKDMLGFERYYRIKSTIDSELAEEKIRTLQHYYPENILFYHSLQVLVEGERIRVLLTLNCFTDYKCQPLLDADPEGYVVPKFDDFADVVVLFDGVAESSDTPFEGSGFERISNEFKVLGREAFEQKDWYGQNTILDKINAQITKDIFSLFSDELSDEQKDACNGLIKL